METTGNKNATAKSKHNGRKHRRTRTPATAARHAILGAFFLTLACIGPSFGARAAEEGLRDIGVATAVNPDAEGIISDNRRRQLLVGSRMFFQEQVRTGPDGQTQLLFLDGSALTVGPSSAITIDKFVYDPDAKAGTLALSAAKGLFRFVGGRISKKTPVVLKTPSATIGIRGGIALFDISAGGAVTATFLFGEAMTIDTPAGSQRITVPGFQVRIPAPGKPPLPPVPAAEKELNAALAALESKAKADDVQPVIRRIRNRLKRSGIQRIGSGINPRLFLPAALSSVRRPVAEDDPLAARLNEASEGSLTQFILENAQSLLTVFTGRIKFASNINFGTDDGILSSNVPILASTIINGALVGEFGSDIFTLRAEPSGSFTVSTALGPNLLGSTAVQGLGHFYSGGDFLYYELEEILAPSNKSVLFAGRPTLLPPAVPITEYDALPDFGLGGGLALFRPAATGNLSTGSDSGAAQIFAVGAPAEGSRSFGMFSEGIVGSGSGQISALSIATGTMRSDSQVRPFLSARMAGTAIANATQPAAAVSGYLASADAGSGHDCFGTDCSYMMLEAARVDANDNILSRGLSERTPSGTVSYNINIPLVPHVPLPGDVPLGSQPRTAEILEGFTSGLNILYDPNSGASAGSFANEVEIVSSSISTIPDTSRVRIIKRPLRNEIEARFQFIRTTGTTRSYDIRFGDPDGSDGFSFFGDDSAFAATATDNQALVNGVAAAANIGMINDNRPKSDGAIEDNLGDAAYCACLYTQWGLMAGEIESAGQIRDVFHMMPWVAGVKPPDLAINGLSGTATYNGHAFGQVFNGSSFYLERGSFTMNWNFSTASGTATISQFDGNTFQYNLSGTGAVYSGGLTSPGGFSGKMDGAFYAGGGNPAAETGGQFTAQSGSYKAAGIFVAKQ